MVNKKRGRNFVLFFEPAEGFGPPTPRLQITCSTAELRRQCNYLSFCECKGTTFFKTTKHFFNFFEKYFLWRYLTLLLLLLKVRHLSENQ